ncbi:hypothetical protein ABIE08_002861 [Kaistia defluvii]|uniref:TauD/TfdA-like domain-containing protein n=1 Tax=Kaistia defluvii TaxID=410841 RepID=A0ABV2R2K5_9HYPH
MRNQTSGCLLEELKSRGLLLCERRGGGVKALFGLVQELAPQGVQVARLRPSPAFAARPRSLSASYGVGAFPPHTDFALDDTPPRYIALVCPVRRSAHTLIYDPQPLLGSNDAMAGVFRVSTNRKNFSTRFLSRRGAESFIRYNSDTMLPLDGHARQLADKISTALDPCTVVDWSTTVFVVIDNWRFLHGRSAVADNVGWLWRLALRWK